MQAAAPEVFDNSTVFARVHDVVSRNIVDEIIIVPISGNLADMQAIFAVDCVAAFIWDHLDGTRSLKDLSALVTEEFDVEPRQAREDLEQFLAQLISTGLITVKQQ